MQDLQQDDMLFRVRYKLVTVESAADKAAGQVTKDESKVFQATIDILENNLSSAKADSELLADQSKTSFNELSKILNSSLKFYLVPRFYFTASLNELGARSSRFIVSQAQRLYPHKSVRLIWWVCWTCTPKFHNDQHKCTSWLDHSVCILPNLHHEIQSLSLWHLGKIPLRNIAKLYYSRVQ